MRKRLPELLIVILCFINGLARAADTYNFSRVPLVSEAPVLDGRINPEEWKSAAVLTPFSSAVDAVVADSPTRVFIQYDSENLYLAFHAVIDFEPSIEKRPHDSLDLDSYDSVEISIVPPTVKKWMRFSLERGGGTCDLRVIGQVRQPAEEWDPRWSSAVRVVPQDFFAANDWEGEIAIPWKTLEMNPPTPGDELPFQFVRYAGNTRRSSRLNNRVSTWAPVPSVWNIIDPNGFGHLIFGGDAPALSLNKYADANKGECGILGRFTGTAPGAKLNARIWHVSDYQKVFGKASSLPISPDKLDWDNKLSVKEKTRVFLQWKLEDDLGVIAGSRALFDVLPLFQVEAAPIYSEDRLALIGDLSRLEITGGMKIVSMLVDSSGKKFASSTKNLTEGARYFEDSLSFKKLPTGTEGIARVSLCKASRIVHSYVYRFKNPARPEWVNQDYGVVTAPPPGWEPITVSRENEITKIGILDNTYSFGDTFLPQDISLRGEKFLSGPMKFNLVTAAGGEQVFSSEPAKVIAEDKRGVTIGWKGSTDEVGVKAIVRVEFDGLAWYRFVCSPLTDSVKISHLSLNLPVMPEKVRYMRGTNVMGTMSTVCKAALVGSAKTDRPLPEPNIPTIFEFSGNGWKFEDGFCNFLWLGGEDRGIFFVLNSLHNMSIAKKYTEVVDTPEKFEFQLNLIDTETPLTYAREYEIGTILTPSKKRVNPSRLRRAGAAFNGLTPDAGRSLKQDPEVYKKFGGRFFHDPELKDFEKDYFTTAILTCWNVKTAMVGNPTPGTEELARIDTEIASIRRTIGGMPMLWYDSLFTMFHLPQAKDYVYEWERYPICRLPIEQYGTFVCPTKAWADYYLYGAVQRMKQGIESFYMDMSSFHSCSNRFHGHGYRDRKTGEVIPGVPFLEGREMFLRYQNLVKKNNPEGLLVMHKTVFSPLALWVDVITSGEEWTQAPDYSTMSPEFYQLTHMGSEQLGTETTLFPGLILTHYPQAAKGRVTLAEVCGLTFSHGESMWNGSPAQLGGLRMVWDALDRFGVDEKDSQWIPYWRNPLNRYPEGVLVSSWKKTNAELLVVFNTEYTEETMDLSSIQSASLCDEMTGKRITGEKLLLGPRDCKIILLKNVAAK